MATTCDLCGKSESDLRGQDLAGLNFITDNSDIWYDLCGECNKRVLQFIKDVQRNNLKGNRM